MKKMTIIGLLLLALCLTISCGKKNEQPQSKQGIVPANLFVSIPGSKIGN